MIVGRAYDEVELAQRFRHAMTITETHLVLGAGLFGDINPLHVDQPFAAGSRFGGRIAHGYITSSFMAAALGMLFHGTAVAYLEHRCSFTAPVRAGDTVTVTWTLRGKTDKPQHGGGIVDFEGVCHNQDGTEVAAAQARMLILSRAAATASPAISASPPAA